MAIIQTLTTSFCSQLLEGVHDFTSSGNVFKLALYDSTANLGSSTAAYTTTGEVVDSGYTAGGATLTNVGTASAGTTGYCSFNTVTWVSTGLIARGALIYNSDATGYTNPSVMVLNFGMDRSAVSGTFTLTFPTSNQTSAIIRINAA